MELLSDYTPPATGVLIMRNVSGDTDEIDYTGWTVVGDNYIFTTTGALSNTYPIGSDVMPQDPDLPGREGPLSDESLRLTVDPGEILKLTTPLPEACTKQIIYRSDTSDYYELEDDVETDVYYDHFTRA